MPWINFFRSLSPIAWIPFAIIWFGIGDPPAIFIIFIATFFQIVLATAAAAARGPEGLLPRRRGHGAARRADVLFQITLPAILPQLVTALRVAIGVAWMVVVAAEMIAVRSGPRLPDRRRAQRPAHGPRRVRDDHDRRDRHRRSTSLFARLARIPSVRWGFDR